MSVGALATAWYQHPEADQGCFRSALANLLLHHGDQETARKAYGESWSNGKYLYRHLLTRYVTEVTGGTYEGHLFTRSMQHGALRFAQHYSQERRSMIEEELEHGRIHPLPDILTAPSIVIFKHDGPMMHAVLYLGKQYIDGSRERAMPPMLPQHVEIHDLLTIHRNDVM